MPLISVVLPVYNGGAYLQQSVESVLNQECKDFELLILDDCSTDGSRKYLEGLRDPRIVYFKNEHNKGLFFNLNFLIDKSTTNLIKLWSQDDIMYANCLGTIVDFHTANPEISFSYSDRTIIDEVGKIIPNSNIDKTPEIIDFELHSRIAFFTGSIAGNIANVCMNKQKFISTRGFDEGMKISGDFDMWVKLSKLGNIGRIKQHIIYLRNHSGQLSRKSEYMLFHVKEDLQVYKHLFSLCNDSLRNEGLILLRKHKFVFYYTLMTKAFLKRELRIGIEYYNILNPFTNLFIQYWYLAKAKLFKKSIPDFLNFSEKQS